MRKLIFPEWTPRSSHMVNRKGGIILNRITVFFKRHRPLLAACLLGLCGIVICALCIAPKSRQTAAAQRDLPIYCVKKSDKVCSLSFDAAWGNEDTQQLIDILGKYDVKATFFVVGEWVDRYPESVKALADAGHEIMNHSDDHPYCTKLSADQLKAQLDACNQKIQAITGVSPVLFRPPYGDYNDKVVSTVRDCGMYCIQWDVDSLDWKDPPPEKITARVLERVTPGSIVLFHNAAKNTPQALPEIIEGLIREGYSIVPISQLIYRENYYMDHTGRQIPQ